ncbi:MAG: hypothetical protein ABSF12_18300 [Bryobacteraceae bacterium]|jgi:hypothetical protein
MVEIRACQWTGSFIKVGGADVLLTLGGSLPPEATRPEAERSPDLRLIATGQYLWKKRKDQTREPTALVNEVYFRDAWKHGAERFGRSSFSTILVIQASQGFYKAHSANRLI